MCVCVCVCVRVCVILRRLEVEQDGLLARSYLLVDDVLAVLGKHAFDGAPKQRRVLGE